MTTLNPLEGLTRPVTIEEVTALYAYWDRLRQELDHKNRVLARKNAKIRNLREDVWAMGRIIINLKDELSLKEKQVEMLKQYLPPEQRYVSPQ